MLHLALRGLLVGSTDRLREFDGRLHGHKESALLNHPWLKETHMAIIEAQLVILDEPSFFETKKMKVG